MRITDLLKNKTVVDPEEEQEKEEYTAAPYQNYTTNYIIDNDTCGVFLDMGLGKTISTLTAIDLLIFRYFDVHKVLVVAPKLVARDTWPQEIEKWKHLHRLKYSCLVGTETERIAALNEDAHIYLINYDNLPWLVAQLGGWWPFDMVVADESSRLKNHASKRVTALKAVYDFIDRFVLLTGTPMANGYIDLWQQLWFVDKGERLGAKISHYRRRWFVKDHSGWGWDIRDADAAKEITRAIRDRVVSMKRKDYLSLPERIVRDIKLTMPADLRAKYKAFEKEKVMELVESEEPITAVNAAVLANKLMQFANGAVYDDDKRYHVVHDMKLEVLEEILESANGHSVLVAYHFESDCQRIMKALKKYEPEKLGKRDFVKRWNEGKIKFGLAHPQSAGHGLNLQFGGHIIVFFGHNWSNELTQQFIARLERKGQAHSVIVHRIIMKGTIDTRVILRQEKKYNDEEFLMQQVKALIKSHVGDRMEEILARNARLTKKPKRTYYDFL